MERWGQSIADDFSPEFEKAVLAAMDEREGEMLSIEQIVRRMAAMRDELPQLLMDRQRYDSLGALTTRYAEHLVKVKKLDRIVTGTKQANRELPSETYYRVRKGKRFGLF